MAQCSPIRKGPDQRLAIMDHKNSCACVYHPESTSDSEVSFGRFYAICPALTPVVDLISLPRTPLQLQCIDDRLPVRL